MELSRYGEALPDGWRTVKETYDEKGEIISRETVIWVGGTCRAQTEICRVVTPEMLEGA